MAIQHAAVQTRLGTLLGATITVIPRAAARIPLATQRYVTATETPPEGAPTRSEIRRGAIAMATPHARVRIHSVTLHFATATGIRHAVAKTHLEI